MDIMALLPLGEANKINAKDLAVRCGCRSIRELQQIIESERCAGNIIASTCRNGNY